MIALKLSAIAAVVLLTACSKDPVLTTTTNNQQVKIDELFTHKGLTVYRFYDHGKPVYFTKRGDVSASYTEYCGKACVRDVVTVTLSGELQ